jgi:hypothetical protein
MKNNVYNNSRTPVNSVCVITCVHDTPAVTVGGGREEIGKEPEVLTSSMTHLMMMERRKRKKAQDIKSSRNRPLHSSYD